MVKRVAIIRRYEISADHPLRVSRHLPGGGIIRCRDAGAVLYERTRLFRRIGWNPAGCQWSGTSLLRRPFRHHGNLLQCRSTAYFCCDHWACDQYRWLYLYRYDAGFHGSLDRVWVNRSHVRPLAEKNWLRSVCAWATGSGPGPDGFSIGDRFYSRTATWRLYRQVAWTGRIVFSLRHASIYRHDSRSFCRRTPVSAQR